MTKPIAPRRVRSLRGAERDRRLPSPRTRVDDRGKKGGKAGIDPAVRDEIAKRPYPRYYLDFETISFTVPRWPGTRAFEQVPFQWSCQIDRGDGSELDHVVFLDLTGDDPSRECAEKLLETLGTRGAIIARDATLEKAVIARLAERFPELAGQLLAISERAVDLLSIACARGSDRDLGRDEAQDGSAQAAYREAIDPETDEDRRDDLAEKLLVDCERDTLAMIKIEEALAGDAPAMTEA